MTRTGFRRGARRAGRIAAALVACAAGGLAGCRERTTETRALAAPAASPGLAVERTDSIARVVRLPERPQRIVSLAPALTEMLFAIGAGEQVVGVTRYCNFPADAATRTKVGGFADPDVERVVALRPDLVLVTADTVARERFDGMAALGLTAFVVNPRDAAQIAGTMRTLGAITGHVAEAEAVAARFEEKVKAVQARVEGKKHVRALFLFSVDPPIAAGPGTFVDEALRLAGAENVAANAPTSYPRFGVEGILASDPDAVLTTVPGGAAALRKMLAGSRVAKSGAIHEVDPDLLERPGPRLADGLDVLARALHPEAFLEGKP